MSRLGCLDLSKHRQYHHHSSDTAALYINTSSNGLWIGHEHHPLAILSLSRAFSQPEKSRYGTSCFALVACNGFIRLTGSFPSYISHSGFILSWKENINSGQESSKVGLRTSMLLRFPVPSTPWFKILPALTSTQQWSEERANRFPNLQITASK